MDCSPPGSSVHGILQAGILEWVAMPSSRKPSQLRDRNYVSHVSYIVRQFLYTSASWEARFSVYNFLISYNSESKLILLIHFKDRELVLTKILELAQDRFS